MKKVAFLSRVSTLEQHTSIDNQNELFSNWLERNKEYIKYKVYEDEGISGSKGYKRKEWLQMLNDGMCGEFDALVVKSFSRFGRNQTETLSALKELRSKGVRIIFLEDGIDTKDKDSDKLGLFAWLAEIEVQKTSNRIKLVWENYNEQGKMHACRPPYGYDYDKEQKKYVVNEIEKDIVIRAFDLYLLGYGCRAIAKIFRDENIPTKNNGKWDSNTINNMIKNEVYIGTLVQGKTKTIDVTMNSTEKICKDNWRRHYNKHEPIVDKERFDIAQIEAEKRSKKAQSTYKRHSNASLFSNILVCGECKSTMSRKKKKSLGYKNKYFCNKYEVEGKMCGHSSISIYESVIIDYIKYKLDNIVNNNYEYFKDKLNSRTDIVKNLKKELNRLDNDLGTKVTMGNKLVELLVNGKLQENLFKLQSDSLATEVTILKNRKEDIKNKLKEIENDKEVFTKLENGVTRILETNIEDWNNAMLRAIVDKIEVYENETIEIKYKYLFNE